MKKLIKFSIPFLIVATLPTIAAFAQVELVFQEFTKSSTSVKVQLTQEIRAQDLCRSAHDSFLKQDFENAIKYCNSAIEINSLSIPAFRIRAYSHFLTSAHGEGCRDLKTAIQLSEKSSLIGVLNKQYSKYCTHEEK